MDQQGIAVKNPILLTYQADRCYAWPNNRLIWIIHAIYVARQNVWTVDVGPNADSRLFDIKSGLFGLRVTQESPKVAGVGLTSQEYQQLLCKLKAARKLAMDLMNAVKEKDERW